MDGFPLMGIPDTGDTAWMLASSALVLLMTPGLAFFYGGMVRAKGVLNMLMMSISAMGVVTVLWVLYGYSLAFGNDVGNLFGDPAQYFGLKGLIGGNAAEAIVADPSAGIEAADAVNIPLAGTIPQLVFVAFQLMFAIITVALISGAVADRLKFGSWLVFAGLWATFVYFPVAHWVFAFDGFTGETGGWIANKLKAIDFAGGTAVHINSGAAGLALALVLGRRKGWPTTPMRPHNLPFVMLGAGLLWFGWYGFNAGSALSSNGIAATTFVTTTVATATAMLAWLLVEKIRDGHATTLGAASGIVAGLVAITPSCSSVNVLGALVVGAPWRRDLCSRCRLEVQVRLRRRSRRGRSPLGRWSDGHPADRLPRRPGGACRRHGSVLRRWGRSTVAPGGGCVCGSRLLVHRYDYLGVHPEIHHRPSPG